MRTLRPVSGCFCGRVTRRRLLASSCGACAAAALPRLLGAAAPAPGATKPAGKTRVRIIYSLHAVKQPGPDWPNKGFDFGPVMKRIDAELARLCGDIEFVSSMASGGDVSKLLAADKAGGVDGYLVYQLNCWNRVVQPVVATGKPVLYADFQFGGSGGFLVYTAAFLRRKTPNVGFVASSRLEDVAAAARCFSLVGKGGSAADFAAAVARVRAERAPKAGDPAGKDDALKCLAPAECLRRMKESRLLIVSGNDSRPGSPIMGIATEQVSYAEVNDAWKAADKDESRAVADRWQKTAAAVVGVSRETLETSAAMYLGMKAVLKKHSANGITINCLGGFYGRRIHAYPCLGFHELNNEGMVGGCEADVRSATTMLAGAALTGGRPGYISDPVIDTAKRQIIYAHCVASNKVFGPAGPANPFQILTHSEDRQGASVRSILPAGHITTSMEMDARRKEVLLHQAKSVGNDDDDRACRTKLCGEPLGDIEKLFGFWDQWGWHRVTFYGDLKAGAAALAEAMGWKVVEEA